MNRNTNLLQGDIKKSLVKMSLPLMGVAFIQVTYEMVDMFFLGRLSEEAVAAVGTVGLLTWVGRAVSFIGKVGTAALLSRSYGKGDKEASLKYLESGIFVNLFFAIIFSTLSIFGAKYYLGFFNLEEEVFRLANEYLIIVALNFVVMFLNPVFATAYHSVGNSVTPFYISVIGIVANCLLDPILIYGFDMGIKGAALATVIAQILIFVTYLIFSKKNGFLISSVNIFKKPDLQKVFNIIKIGYPPCVQSSVQAFISMVLNRYIAAFGSMSMAVYTIGVKIESISWMTAEGFSIAMTAFMGQNLGAENYDRIKDGYREGLKVFGIIGAFATFVLVVLGETLMGFFLPNNLKAIAEGGKLLKVFGAAEILTCLEIGTSGSLNGLGLTKFTATTSILGNLIRIPMAKILIPIIGVAGVWTAVSFSMAIKGIMAVSIFMYLSKKTDNFRKIKSVVN